MWTTGRALTAAALLLGLVAGTACGDPITIDNFGRVSFNSSSDITDQISLSLASDTKTTVLLTVKLGVGVDGVITNIYFGNSDTGLLSGVAYKDADPLSDISFDENGKPAAMKNVSWSTSFMSGATSSPPKTGIEDGEWGRFTLSLDSAASTKAAALTLIAGAIRSEQLHFGLHAQSIGADEESDWYTVVPEPSTIALLGLGFAGLGVLRRRRR